MGACHIRKCNLHRQSARTAAGTQTRRDFQPGHRAIVPRRHLPRVHHIAQGARRCLFGGLHYGSQSV